LFLLRRDPVGPGYSKQPDIQPRQQIRGAGNYPPSPNEYRTASGAPGPKYWQQRCDYDITCNLDEDKLLLTGSETISYFNNSPNELTYLWMQLDENQHSSKYNANYQDGSSLPHVGQRPDAESRGKRIGAQ
jgi:hypothetical protein